MRVQYKRNLNQSYMIVTSEVLYSGYQIHMCKKNRIKHLLSFDTVAAEGKMQFWYEITGKRSLDHVLESSEFAMELFVRIIETLLELCSVIKPYLLEEEGILLEPECIYVENGSSRIVFGYCPGKQESITESFRHLMEYLLSKINHDNEQMVLAGYEVYQKSTEEGFSLTEILQILYQYRQQDVAAYVPPRTSRELSERDVVYQEEDDSLEEKQGVSEEERFFERYWKQCRNFLRHFPDWLPRKEKKPQNSYTYTPQDYEEEVIDMPTVCLTAEEEIEGILKYEGKGEVENLNIDHFPFVIGSSNQADGVVTRQGVSRMHARITKEGEDYYIEDLNSMNGTWLNEEMLEYRKKACIHIRDTIRLGREKFIFM